MLPGAVILLGLPNCLLGVLIRGIRSEIHAAAGVHVGDSSGEDILLPE